MTICVDQSKILQYVDQQSEPVDVRNILAYMATLDSSYKDRDVVLAVHDMLDRYMLQFTPDRRLELFKGYKIV